MAIGSLLPSLIIGNKEGTSNEFFILLISINGFTLLTTLLTIIIFRSNPPSPPSPSEEHYQQINIKEDLIKLLTNYQYLILLVGFSFGLGICSAVVSVLDQLIAPSGYTSEDAGVFGAAVIIAGIFNSFFVGFIMDKTHAYRLILKILLIGACGSGILFLIFLQPNKFYPLAVSLGLMGFFFLPLLPVSFECAVECTYPIRAEWSTGLLLCTGNIFGAIYIYVLEYLIQLAPTYKPGQIFTPAAIFMLCFYIISGVPLFLYKGPYLRLQAEKRVDTTSTLNTS